MQEFVELIRMKNYSRAAEKLYISQSTLSKHIAAIETELGASLLNHDYHGIELTPLGKDAHDEFSRILASYSSLKQRAEKVAVGLRGGLRVGVPYYAARKFASPILKRFVKTYPEIELDVISGQPEQLFSALLSGEFDASFNVYCTEMTVPEGDRLDILDLASEKPVVLCAPDCPLATRESISIADLSGAQLVSYRTGPFTDAYVQAITTEIQKRGIRFVQGGNVENADPFTDIVLDTGSLIIVPKHAAAFHSELAAVEIDDLTLNHIGLFTDADNANPAIPLLRSMALRTRHTL